MSRTFEASPAVRKEVPLILAIFSPSGGGKTYSALELATGIQTVYQGDILVIDTESNRALHYAFDPVTKRGFVFKHVPFAPPFSPKDYLAAGQFAVAQKPACVVWDSTSHEHDGPGGVLEMHEAELDRMAGNDWNKRDKMNLAGWIRPKAERRGLINWMIQTKTPMIFCFRARELTKLVGGQGEKSKMVDMGFTPIGATDFIFEALVSCFLPPRANGIPDWQSEYPNERLMMKRPEQFEALLKDGVRLTREVGRELALWAKGGEAKHFTPPAPPADLPEGWANWSQEMRGENRANKGAAAFREWWKTLGKEDRDKLAGKTAEWKDIAEKADAAKAKASSELPLNT